MTLNARRTMAKDKKNCLVHLSSILGDMSLPFHGVYSGTKTFNKVFGRMVYMGKYPSSPDTLVVKPGIVTTGMTDYHRDPTSADPEDTVLGVTREMGLRAYGETNGAFVHSVMGESRAYTPDFVMHGIRNEAGKLDKAPYK
jgi:short-subunit dehydrogenase